MTRLLPEPDRDPKLAQALRRLDREDFPRSEAALVQRIMLGAGPVLGARRQPERAWWEQVAGWSGFAMPAAVGLGIAAAAVLYSERGAINPAWSSDSLTVTETMLSAATLPRGEVPVEDQLLAPVSDEWLISGAMTASGSK